MKPDRTFSRRERRVYCVLTALAVLGFAVTFDGQVPTGARWLGFAVLPGLFTVLVVNTRGLAFRFPKRLDEREVQLMQAHQRGYGFAVGIIVGSLLSEFTTLSPFTFKPAVTVTLEDLVYWLCLILLAPTLIVAWTEPDLPAEEVRAASNA